MRNRRGTRTLTERDIKDILHADELNSITLGRVLRTHDLGTISQIQYWEEYGYIKSTNADRYNRHRIYTQDQFRKIWFLTHLVNQVGLRAKVAHKLAEIIAEKSFDDPKPIIWVTYKGITLGLPNLVAETLHGNPRN